MGGDGGLDEHNGENAEELGGGVDLAHVQLLRFAQHIRS